MAAVSTFQPTKRKKLVYGRAARTNFNNASFFDDEDELSAGTPTVGRQSKVKASYTVQKTEARPHALKPGKPKVKKADTFEVPSSDDEVTEVRSLVAPPKYRPNLVDDTGESEVVSWHAQTAQRAARREREAAAQSRAIPEADGNSSKLRETADTSKSPRLKSGDSAGSQISPPRNHSGPTLPPQRSPNDETSAAARLAARRKPVEKLTSSKVDESSSRSRLAAKRAVSSIEQQEAAPRKRMRTESQEDLVGDVQMLDVRFSPASSKAVSHHEMDIYEVPDDAVDVSPRLPKVSSNQSINGNAGRGDVSGRGSSTVRKGLSAPARLAEMVATDSDTTEAPTRSPSTLRSTPQPPSTPQRGLGDLSRGKSASPGTMTPRQATLWNKLLPDEPIVPSPSSLPIQSLNISGKSRPASKAASRRLTKATTAKSRVRLVDRLKASAPTTESDASSEADSDGEHDEGDAQPALRPAAVTLQEEAQRPQMQRQVSQVQSQQSQSSTSGTGGPKVTYSRMRSYLPEDNFEADLMLGLAEEPQQRPALNKRMVSQQSQKSAFDLEDSEDEDGPGKIRSIHELRAQGSTARGMVDIQDLLDEIGKHNVAQRNARRTALVSLATQMMDSSFRARFVGQGFEAKLAAEATACSDEIAEFLFVACFALLLESKPPEHVVRTLHGCNITTWLAERLGRDIEVPKMVKDRRHNMSKVSQSAVLELAEKIRMHAPLWTEQVPLKLSFRLMTLKALDLLVRAIRELGDRAKLLNEELVGAVMVSNADKSVRAAQLDLALSVSILESLSNTASSLAWPADLLNRLASLLPSFDTEERLLRHTRFLSLRLCLNLTNNSPDNCRMLCETCADSTPLVAHLLQSIKTGFSDLHIEQDEEKKTIALDLLVLAIGIMINLSEHSAQARAQSMQDPALLETLLGIFQRGKKRMEDAESEAESVANVTYAYLAVMLANVCQDPAAKTFMAERLPGRSLGVLVEAVEEFVAHHQKVDALKLEGEEGWEVWGAFTEKLKVVLGRLRES